MMVILLIGFLFCCVSISVIPFLGVRFTEKITWRNPSCFMYFFVLTGSSFLMFLLWVFIILHIYNFADSYVGKDQKKELLQISTIKKTEIHKPIIVNPEGKTWKHPEITMKFIVDPTKQEFFLHDSEKNQKSDPVTEEHWEILEQDDLSHELEYPQVDPLP